MNNNTIYYSYQKIPNNYNGENLLPKNVMEHIHSSHKINASSSIYAWELLRKISGIDLSNVKFLPSGKPVILNSSISLSHSDNYVCVAFSKGVFNIGIDVEKINAKKNEFLKKFFNTDLSLKQLFNLWTKHEATVKALNKSPLTPLHESFLGETKIINDNEGEYSLSIYSEGYSIKEILL
ncbi:MAG: hypothetical protein J6Q38_06370 [Clostridia bacterium]|nr:hypothetical protein [Clostridia bacterium]